MRRMVFGLALTIVAGAFLVLPATAAHASWVSNNCYIHNAPDYHVRRVDAKAYAYVGVDEGYEFGGGCWNDDDRDDTPGEPDSDGEGPDCSGFTFKTWELKATIGRSGFQWWDRFQDIHGPYTSTSFHAPQDAWPFYKLPDKRYSTTTYMDAFARDGHVGMLWVTSQPQDQTDSIIEARGDSSGTGIFIEGFRFDSDYIALRREGWTPDCWPDCGMPQGGPVRVP